MSAMEDRCERHTEAESGHLSASVEFDRFRGRHDDDGEMERVGKR